MYHNNVPKQSISQLYDMLFKGLVKSKKFEHTCSKLWNWKYRNYV